MTIGPAPDDPFEKIDRQVPGHGNLSLVDAYFGKDHNVVNERRKIEPSNNATCSISGARRSIETNEPVLPTSRLIQSAHFI